MAATITDPPADFYTIIADYTVQVPEGIWQAAPPGGNVWLQTEQYFTGYPKGF